MVVGGQCHTSASPPPGKWSGTNWTGDCVDPGQVWTGVEEEKTSGTHWGSKPEPPMP